LEKIAGEWGKTGIWYFSGGLKRLKGSRFGSPSIQEDKTILDLFPICNPVSSARLKLPDFRLLSYYQALNVPLA